MSSFLEGINNLNHCNFMCVMNTMRLFELTQTLRVIGSYLSISSTSKVSDEQGYILKFYIPISNKNSNYNLYILFCNIIIF